MLNLLSHVAGLNDLIELSIDVVGSPDLLEHGLSFVEVASFDQAVGGVGDQQCSDGEKDGRNSCEGEG